jgi:hypothetical protein
MERIIATTHKNQEPIEKERSPLHSTESQIFLQPKRISDDSRDAEMCDKTCDTDEELNVDVENDDTLCPVDLTRRQDKFTSFENLIPSNKTDSSSDFISFKDMKRSESVCSDDVSRSESPRDQSPSVVPHQNRRLAFSVENILDPNKFTGRQGVYSDGICCWKPHDGSRGSPEYDDSETGEEICGSLSSSNRKNFRKLCTVDCNINAIINLQVHLLLLKHSFYNYKHLKLGIPMLTTRASVISYIITFSYCKYCG